MNGRPLLILSCSATKRDDAWELTAFDRYDGPAYRVLRASGWPNVDHGPNCRVVILSAQHGLLSAWAQIADYDRLMDDARADELAAMDIHDVRRALFYPFAAKKGEIHEHFPASAVFVWGGGLYRRVVQAWEDAGVFNGVPGGVRYSSGGIGTQLGQLKAWLDGTRERRQAA